MVAPGNPNSPPGAVPAGEPMSETSEGGAAPPGAAASSGTSSSGLFDKLKDLLARDEVKKLKSVALKSAVGAVRQGLVPIAEQYAKPAEPIRRRSKDELPDDTLTSVERAALSRAAEKLVLEAGDLLVTKYAPEYGAKLPDRKPDATGSRGELSLAMAVAAVRGAQSVYRDYAEKKAEAEREAALAEQAENLRPVSIQALRARNRG